ncbi:hypothetical protein P59_132 [Bacillus phage P59]|nr:hypothetical protein P59_132 [Bacillus phage P59]
MTVVRSKKHTPAEIANMNKKRITNRLKGVQERAKRGIHTHQDYRAIVGALLKLTEEVYDMKIEMAKEEESNATDDQSN